MPEDEAAKSSGIPTNMRLLMVLEAVAKAGVPLTPTEVNATLGLPKPTVHRLFHTLETEGFLQRDLDGRSYAPGQRIRRLSVNVLSSLRVRTARLAILNRVAEEIGETCNIATPDRDAMVYLDRVETKWPLRIQLPVGTAVPFHCTASGKMYLSTLKSSHQDRYLASARLERRTPRTMVDPAALKREIEEIKVRGYSADDEEFMTGMTAVAVPIRDEQSRLLSTLSVHAPIQRVSLEELKSYIPLLNRAAADLAALLLEEDTG